MPKVAKHNYQPILAILGVSAIITAAFLISQRIISPEQIGINEVTSAGTVSLEASPPPNHLILGKGYTIDINARLSGGTHLTAIQLELLYDPAKLAINNVAIGNFLPIQLSAPAVTSNMIKATLGAEPNSGGKTDWGTVATITVTPTALGTQTLTFGPKTLATVTELSGNALSSVKDETMTVYNLGDINFDKVINLLDYNQLVTDYGKSGYSPADLNWDSQVNLFDYNIFVTNYGKTSP